MSLGENEFARRDVAGVETRPDARLSWSLDDLTTSDSHRLRVRFGCGARVADSSADRRMFAQVMLGIRPSVSVETIIEHFAPALKSAAAICAAGVSAVDWAEHRSDQTMLDALLSAANGAAFACGLEILPPYQLNIS